MLVLLCSELSASTNWRLLPRPSVYLPQAHKNILQRKHSLVWLTADGIPLFGITWANSSVRIPHAFILRFVCKLLNECMLTMILCVYLRAGARGCFVVGLLYNKRDRLRFCWLEKLCHVVTKLKNILLYCFLFSCAARNFGSSLCVAEFSGKRGPRRLAVAYNEPLSEWNFSGIYKKIPRRRINTSHFLDDGYSIFLDWIS